MVSTATWTTPPAAHAGTLPAVCAPRRSRRRAPRRRPARVGPGRRGRRAQDGRDRARGGAAVRLDGDVGARAASASSPAPPDDPGAGRAFDNGPAWSGIKPWTFPSRVDALSVETRDDGCARRQRRGAAAPSRPRSSAPAPATSPRSPCTTACSPAARPSIPTTPRAAPTCSSSPSSARLPPRPASAPRWAPARRSRPAPTSSSPRSTAASSPAPAARPASGCSRRLGLAPAAPSAGDAGRRARSRPCAPGWARRRRPRASTTGCSPTSTARAGPTIAERCLACANCTLVCPTCFCTGTVVTLRPRRPRIVRGAAVGQLLHRRLRAGRGRRQLPPASTRTATASG